MNNTYTLYNGCCIDVMKNNIPDNSIDLIVTSPPYNLNIKYSTYSDNKPYEEYLQWIKEVFTQVQRVLTPDGHLFLNVSSSSKQPWISMDVANTLRDLFYLQNNICWVKSIELDNRVKGHNKPIKGNRYLPRTWENIYHFTKNGNSPLDHEQSGVPYAESSREGNIKRSGRDWRQSVNTWFIPYESFNQHNKHKVIGDHPAVFPKALVSKCIKLAGCKGVLLDPFVGSGSSIIAALENNIDSIGIDIDSKYLEFAKQRIEQYNEV